jgi:hypothetical protein
MKQQNEETPVKRLQHKYEDEDVNKMQNEIKQKNKPGCGKQAR